MSIKGCFKTLYVGKEKSTIEYFLGKRRKVIYENLSRIEYAFSDQGKCGYIDFIYPSSTVIRFDFRKVVNDKISRTITLIQENNPELLIIEHVPKESKFYHNLFVIFLMFFCCAPIGLFLMWHNKKFTKLTRSIITTFFIIIWCAGISFSFHNYMGLKNKTIETLSQIYNTQPYQEIHNSTAENNDISIESLETQAFSTTLTAGHYLVGTDIPVGTYNFFSKSGTGNIYSDDGAVNAIFDHDNISSSLGIENLDTDEIRNIYLNDGVIVTVTGAQQISAGCDDGLVSSMKSRNQEGLKAIEVGYGHYGASDDIPAGTYDVEWIEGSGNIICSSSMHGGINEIMGDDSIEIDEVLNTKIHIKEFRNLTLEVGDILEIDSIKIKLIPSQ